MADSQVAGDSEEAGLLNVVELAEDATDLKALLGVMCLRTTSTMMTPGCLSRTHVCSVCLTSQRLAR